MRNAPLLLAPALAGFLGLAACDQPKWREKPAPAADTAATPATAAPKTRTIPADPGGTPAAPAWAEAVIGKPFREVYPKTGICKGNTDIVYKTYAGSPAGVQLHGWGWDEGRKAHVARIILVDKSARVIGAGDGGVPRSDVPATLPEITDANTGWIADIAVSAGQLDAYGVVGGGDAVCVLGHIEF